MTTHAAAAASVPHTAPRRASGPGRIAIQCLAQQAATFCQPTLARVRSDGSSGAGAAVVLIGGGPPHSRRAANTSAGQEPEPGSGLQAPAPRAREGASRHGDHPRPGAILRRAPSNPVLPWFRGQGAAGGAGPGSRRAPGDVTEVRLVTEAADPRNQKTSQTPLIILWTAKEAGSRRGATSHEPSSGSSAERASANEQS